MGRGARAAVIDYPSDRPIAAQAKAHDLPEPVLVRDLVRVVEVLNLKQQDFFHEKSVLAGRQGAARFEEPWVVPIRMKARMSSGFRA